MNDPAASSLAAVLVKESFGERCESIARILLDQGSSRIDELVRESGLRPKQVQQALLVLVQVRLSSMQCRSTLFFLPKGIPTHSVSI